MRTESTHEWLTIHEASTLVGVSPATLRRWSNAGDVRTFTTPGGHRRFSRAAVLGMLPPANRGRPALASLGQSTAAITRAYRRSVRGSLVWPASIAALAPTDREPFRACGRSIVSALIDYLDADAPREAARRLAVAEAAIARHGQIAALHGVPLRDTVALFLRFRAPLLHELAAVARRRALDATDATGLLEAATDAIDRLMPALIAGHEDVNSAHPACQPACATGVLDVPQHPARRP
jgi:excisionase family DNA binding protein